MTNKVNGLPHDQFVAIWNASESLDEVVAKIQAIVGLPAPRWAVIARAAGCRKEELKQFPETTRSKVAG